MPFEVIIRPRKKRCQRTLPGVKPAALEIIRRYFLFPRRNEFRLWTLNQPSYPYLKYIAGRAALSISATVRFLNGLTGFLRKAGSLVRLDIIHPHALQRMEERGASREEVRRTIEAGRVFPARFGRQKYGMTFSFGNYWRAQLYEHKHIEAYCVVDGEDIIVVTVVVKYF